MVWSGQWMSELIVDGVMVKVTNPEKFLWPELGIRKIGYIEKMIELGPYILPHAQNRLLTAIRYPDGINGKSFYQKNTPAYAPEWLQKAEWNNTNYILLNSMATLIWLCNQAVLEFHTAFDIYKHQEKPTSLVFDLDPSKGQSFEEVIEIALLINETLLSLNIQSLVKTSGATGLQIYIPIGSKYDFLTARKINQFFGIYFSQKFPDNITIERLVSKRGNKLYFDYLQMWQGKTITMVYSPRATEMATVSMPITWIELSKGIKVEDFNLLNAKTRIDKMGDLFYPITQAHSIQDLDFVLEHI